MKQPKIPDSKPINIQHAEWHTHQVFGFNLSSNFPFANRLTPASAPLDLTFTCQASAPFSIDLNRYFPAYNSPIRTNGGRCMVTFYRVAGWDIFHFSRVADFYIRRRRIICHLLDPSFHYLVEIYFLGPILSFWMERQGIPTLHASSVVIKDRAIVFLSGNRAGKSALAATFMQVDIPLLTDDILPLEYENGLFWGRPGYPDLRMWPAEAAHFLGSDRELSPIHPAVSKRRIPVGRDCFGRFHRFPQPLACIYFPHRRDPSRWGTGVKITPAAPSQAVMELVRYSFSARITAALGWQKKRLLFFAKLVLQVPMRRLAYPEGFEHLPSIRKSIMNDLKK